MLFRLVRDPGKPSPRVPPPIYGWVVVGHQYATVG